MKDADVPELQISMNAGWLDPFGGVETSTLHDCLALSARGHRISLMYGQDGAQRPAFEAAGVALEGPFNFNFRPRHAVHDLASFLPSARSARRRQSDVIWLNRVEHLIWGVTTSRLSGAPLVAQLHGLPAYHRLSQLSRGVAHFLAVSEFVRERYIERGVAPERISRLYNAIPPGQYPVGGSPERMAARHMLDLPADRPIVLCYGRLGVPKGALTLLEAWPLVQAQQPDAYLVLVDSTSGDPDRTVMTALEGMPPGSVRRFPMTTDVLPFLHACDVVAFPTWLPETFGRVVLEGMSTGRPVVASRVGALPEVLSGAMARFLVEPRSAEALAAGLLDVLDWRDAEPDLGTRCTRWVEERFPFSAHVDGLEATFAQFRR